MKQRNDNRTLDLLAWQPPEAAIGYSDQVVGRGAMDNRISRVVAQALREAREAHGLTRDAIAEAMSATLYRRVSPDQLNKWSSEAADSHRIPLDAFIALGHAAEAPELAGFLAEQFDLVAVPKKYAPIIELYEIDEHARQIEAMRSNLKIKIGSAK